MQTRGIMIVVPSSDGVTALRAHRFPRPNDLSLALRTLGI
jgi:hypothetical protein